MSNSMVHWNNSPMCVLDTETTGLEPYYHEIVEIALLPLDSNFDIRKDVQPLQFYMKPNHPDRIDPEAFKVNKLSMEKLAVFGLEQAKGMDILDTWVQKLKIPCNKYGNPNRVILLGHNVSFDIAFMKAWLNEDVYNDIFDGRFRDTMQTALFMNDKAGAHAAKVPFSRVNLSALSHHLSVPHPQAHTALADCVACAQCYKKLCSQGLLQ